MCEEVRWKRCHSCPFQTLDLPAECCGTALEGRRSQSISVQRRSFAQAFVDAHCSFVGI